MITNIKIDNFKGIEKEINLSFIANNRIKRKNNFSTKIDDSINCNKVIGLVGSNGSGKTSFIEAIQTILLFTNFPARKSTSSNNKFLEQLKKIPEEYWEKIIKDFNTLDLPKQNINRSAENTLIEIDIYIPQKENNINGYYTYRLSYDKDYMINGIKEESLQYRKKYKSKIIKEIFSVKNILESELGSTLHYQNNTISSKKSNYDYYRTFGDELIKSFDFAFEYEGIDLIEIFKNSPEHFKRICNIADNKIKDVIVQNNNDKDELVFLNKNQNKLEFNELSEGTRKTIIISCKVLDSLKENKILIIDEIENSLHNSLASFLIHLMDYPFKDTFAQLFFTTHSIFITDLLNYDQLFIIDNKNDDFYVYNAVSSIQNNLISKNKSITNALIENLLISNPDLKKINDFLKIK